MDKKTAEAIAATINSPGWHYIKERLNEVLREAKDDVIDEDDPERAESLRLQLKGGRKLFTRFFEVVERLTDYDEESYEEFANLNFGNEEQMKVTQQ